jgi:hypothetical protein
VNEIRMAWPRRHRKDGSAGLEYGLYSQRWMVLSDVILLWSFAACKNMADSGLRVFDFRFCILDFSFCLIRGTIRIPTTCYDDDCQSISQPQGFDVLALLALHILSRADLCPPAHGIDLQHHITTNISQFFATLRVLVFE